jgi:hypothetical protein
VLGDGTGDGLERDRESGLGHEHWILARGWRCPRRRPAGADAPDPGREQDADP